ncbi:MAG TPA: proline--tRNA ligase [Bacteroidia bacterium]|nr:proline--tRNA ligase [Bacteroidia bacterium]
MSKVLTSRSEDYNQWYQDVVTKANLADHSAVRGCMVIMPHGYAIWEKMQAALDKMFKDTGHSNAYFPLFIPKSFLSKEAKHVEGFAQECAVVTHYRLKTIGDTPETRKVVVDETAKLEEELIVRPTSETIIWNTYRDWIKSHRDLPLLINQWANVVRWEMRTRLFLRTTEFLWQEGHTAHATRQEAIEETERMLDVYADFAENFMALPVLRGIKTANERFAGAEETYCIEGLMQDGKALQCGTSHFLGQNFAKAFEVKYATTENKMEYVWATSWGVSTRLMGALIMSHSDDHGLVVPPKLAPVHVVIVPIFKTDEERAAIGEAAEKLMTVLRAKNISVKLDTRDKERPGYKFAEHELRGVPIRLGIGPKDLANNSVEMARRDLLTKEVVPLEGLVERIADTLDDIQSSLYKKALERRNAMSHYVNTWEEFEAALDKGGFIYAHWDGTGETENKIKEKTKATIRCIPLDNPQEDGVCILSGKPSKERVVFARAY